MQRLSNTLAELRRLKVVREAQLRLLTDQIRNIRDISDEKVPVTAPNASATLDLDSGATITCIEHARCQEHLSNHWSPSSPLCNVFEYKFDFPLANIALIIAKHALEEKARFISLLPLSSESCLDSRIRSFNISILVLMADYLTDSKATVPSLLSQIRLLFSSLAAQCPHLETEYCQ